MSAPGDALQHGEELLAHSDFVRRLARALLHDAHLAEDVAQDAMVAALTQPPPRGGSLRAWLVGVVRNRVRMERRGGVRRGARERAVARPEAVPGPDEAVARLETGRRLVDVVLALEEPYRSTIVMRYLDEWTPEEIARRSGISVSTVKTRLRRGLEQLRARMDRDDPRSRAGWCSALVPLAQWDAATCVGPLLVGGTVMAVKTKVAIVAAAVLGVLAGMVGGNLVQTSHRETAPSDPPPAETAQAPRPPRAGSATRPRGDQPTPAAEGAVPAGSMVVDLGVPAAPTGGGRIRGRTSTAGGDPVSGATVVASPAEDPEFSLPPAPARENLESGVRQAVRAELRRRARERAASSGADGEYEVAGLGDGPYHVSAAHPSYDMDVSPASDGRWVRAGAAVDFLAVPVTSVRVEIVPPAGQLVDEAVLVVRVAGDEAGDENGRRVPWTPDEPELRLRSGTWSVEAFARNGELMAPAEQVVIAAPEAAGPLVLHLREQLGIRGRVLSAGVGDRGFVFVHALRLADGATEEETIPRLVRDGRKETAFGLLDLRFRFEGLDPGRYVLGASRMGGDLIATSAVTLGDRSLLHDLVVPPPADEAFVLVRVFAPDGAPARDAEVHLVTGDWTPPAGFPDSDVRGAGDGTFRVRRQAEEAREAPAWLLVRSAAHGTRELPFDPRAKSPLDVRFDAAATLDVAFLGAEVPAIRGRIAVSLRPARSDDPRGAFSLGHELRDFGTAPEVRYAALQPGEYELAIHVRSASDASARCVATERVTVRPGTNRATVTIPSLSTLTVQVEGATGGESVMLKSLPGGPALRPESRSVGSDGRVSFDLLPAGRYHLTATVAGQLCVGVVDVPSDALVVLRPVGSRDDDR